MDGRLRFGSVFGVFFLLIHAGYAPAFEPAPEQNPVRIDPKEEQSVLVEPKIWVDVFQSNYRPILPRLAGSYIFYSNLNQREARLGCLGRNLYALPIGPVTGSRTERIVAKFDCVLQLQSFGKDLYVIYRYTPPRKENSPGKQPPASELRIDKVDADALKIESNRFPEVIGERGQAAHQVRFAVKMDDLSRSRDTGARRTSLINENELFVIAETGDEKERKTYLDILNLSDPWSATQPMIDVPIESEPVADFLIPHADSLVLALDGGRLKMGRLLFFSWDGKQLKITKEIGEDHRLAPDWTEATEEEFAVRHPRFLALTPNGMIGSDKTHREQQFVFYFPWEEKKFYKIRHLSRVLTQVTGFQFVVHGDEPGLLVADSDNRWIRWYGNRSPFPKDMVAQNIAAPN